MCSSFLIQRTQNIVDHVVETKRMLSDLLIYE